MSGYLNKDAVLERVTKQNVIDICAELGSDYRTDADGNLIFNTKLTHKGGDSYKAYYYHEPNKEVDGDKGRRFVVYTEGRTYSLIDFVIQAFKVKGMVMSWFQALSWIAIKIGYIEGSTPTTKASDETIDRSWIEKQKKNTSTQIRGFTCINEHVLEVFNYSTPITDWLNEGIDSNTLQKFEIGYFARDNAISIPHRDINGQLIGIRQRELDAERIEMFGKYHPTSIEGEVLKHRLGSNFYGLNNTLPAITRHRRILIYESEKSVLKTDSYYSDENYSVAVCGSNLTPTQIAIIKTLKVEKVLLAFDKEYSDCHSWKAEIYKNKLILKLEPLINYASCYLIMDGEDELLNEKDSPADGGKEVLEKLLDSKILVTRDMIERAREDERNNSNDNI